MVSWEKLISQPHQTRLSWNCAFFHEMGAAMAQRKSTTKANMSGALSRKSAHRRSSTKRKALWGFQASNPCTWRSKNAPVRCHQNAEKRPLRGFQGLRQHAASDAGFEYQNPFGSTLVLQRGLQLSSRRGLRWANRAIWPGHCRPGAEHAA